MATLIAMPRLGMIMTEGTLARWLKAEGEQIRRGDLIAEISTDKINYEIEAPDSGLLHQLVPEGSVVEVEGPLAYILAFGEALPVPELPRTNVPTASAAPQVPAPRVGAAVSGVEIRATPVARRLAGQHGIDLAALAGSGPGGRIVEADILRAIEEGVRAAEEVPKSGALLVSRRVPLAGTRGLIARRMMESLQTSAQVTLTIEADASLLAALPALPPARDAALVKALGIALREFPRLNSTVQGDSILELAEINIGVAVSVDDLLLVPVVHAAESKPLSEISRELRELLRKARGDSLTLDDLSGGTFTFSNLGPQGIDIFTPIINPPQSGILGVGRIAERAAVVNGQLAIRPSVWISLTFDHRVVDGALSARFLQRIAELLRDPKVMERHVGETMS